MTCAGCGAETTPDDRFCARCGRPLLGGFDERRVVTVVFADLVGFTTLSEGLDPEKVKLLVDRCFQRLAGDVAAFGGQVDKVVGDAMVALFGASVAHEDDAERAVRAALAMQESLRLEAGLVGQSLQMRVGVNTGPVLVGAMAAAGSITAMGDVVNTASRLQVAAAPGEVLVGPATHDATAAAIEYTSRGLVAAKGREKPVEAWVARAAKVPPGHRHRRAEVPLVGREPEVDLLTGAVDLTVANRRATWALLLGDVGLGKSRLVTEVLRRSRSEHEVTVLEGRCVPYGEANVWAPLAEALRPTLPEVGGLLEGLIRSGDPDPRELGAAGVARAVAEHLGALAAERPLILYIADLQFADDVVLALLDEVLDILSHQPVVLVGTARPAILDRWRPRAGRYHLVSLNLEPLSRDATAELLGLLRGGPVSDQMASEFHLRSGGNPFYLEELVALLDGVDDPSEHRHGHDHQGQALLPSDLPDTLRGVVAARLDDLDPEARSVLQDAAVLGGRGLLEALERMAKFLGRRADVARSLETLVAEELMEVVDQSWAFRSDLVREVAYQAITMADRAIRHSAIATYLDQHVATQDVAPTWVAEQMAHHFSSAAMLAAELGSLAPTGALPDDLTEQAFKRVVEAGRRARRDLALPTARRHHERALELLGPDRTLQPHQAVEVLSELTTLALDLWDLDCARGHLDEAEQLAARLGDPTVNAGLLFIRGLVEHRVNGVDAAVQTLARAAELFGDLRDHAGRARALRERSQIEILAGRIDEAGHSAVEALAEFTVTGDRAGQGWAHQNLAWIAFMAGRTDDADHHAGQAVRIFGELDDVRGRAWAVGVTAWVRFQQGRIDQAHQLADLTHSQALKLGDPWAVAVSQLLLGAVNLWQGRTTDAVVLAEEATAAFERLGEPWGTSQSTALLARSLVMSGEVARGLAVLEPGEESAPNAQLTCLTRAAVAIQIGDPELAAAVEPMLESLVDGGMRESAAIMGMLALQRGDRETAARYLWHPAITTNEPSLTACRALLAAVGGPGDLDDLAASLVSADGVTYMDRALMELAQGLAALGSGGQDPLDAQAARHHLAAAVAATAETGDAVAAAVFRLVSTSGAVVLSDPGADTNLAAAEADLARLGLRASGWRRLVGLAGATPGAPAGRRQFDEMD